MTATWGELVADLPDDAVAMLTAYRDLCRALPGVTERVHRTQVSYHGTRGFTAGFVISGRLELMVQLTDVPAHDRVIATFPVNRRLVGVRLSIRVMEELDESVRALVRRSHVEASGLSRPGPAAAPAAGALPRATGAARSARGDG